MIGWILGNLIPIGMGGIGGYVFAKFNNRKERRKWE